MISIMRCNLKMCKKITKCLLILLAGLSVILALLLLTHPGNKVIISVIESIEPRLSLPLTQGSVFFSPTFENISWQDDSTTLNIEKLNYVFGYSCLVQEICMQQVNIIGVNLHLPVNDSVPVAQEETHEPMALLSLPIKIHLSNIHLKDINVTQGDFAFSFDDLALDVRATKKVMFISVAHYVRYLCNYQSQRSLHLYCSKQAKRNWSLLRSPR